MENSDLRKAAYNCLHDNWTSVVLITLLYLVITSACGCIPYVNFLLSVLVISILSWSFEVMFIPFYRAGGTKLPVEALFIGFRQYGRILGVYWLRQIYVALWTLLLIVPGIIKSYSYAMSFYISYDQYELSAEECIDASIEMMEGHKMDLFLLDLSFIGWYLLSILTFGIGLLWVIPYHQTSRFAFYENLRQGTQEA